MEEGEAFPWGSQRLTLKQIQQLASGLDLPTAATRSDLEVMISGKLTDMLHDPKCVQVIVLGTEQGEELSLQDMGEIFLVVPPVTNAVSKSPTPSEGSWSTEDVGGLLGELAQLRNMLQTLEEGKLALHVELESSRAEVALLKAELSKANEKTLELWQENCKQLIQFDSAILERDREVRLLRERLQLRELELARLKLTNLGGAELQIGGTKSSVKDSVSVLDTGPSVSTGTKSTCLPREGDTSSCSEFHTSRVTTMSDPSRGHMFTSTRVTTTTSSPLEQPTTTTAPGITLFGNLTTTTGNPFSEGHSGTLSLGSHLLTSMTQPVVVSNGPESLISQRELLTGASVPSLSFNSHLNQQVTNLNTSLSDVLCVSRPISSTGIASGNKSTTGNQACVPRRGKAPPVDSFTAEDMQITFDDWVLTLERASKWNDWTAEESLMQLAGYLRGRAAQEWKLLQPEDKISYQTATKALRDRLDPGNQTLAALDFRHIAQQMNESVVDFVGRLEQVFQKGFGHERLSNETRDMLLYGQLQEGLLYSLLESPAVSGAQNYKELCLAAKREERRLNELKKKQQYLLKTDRPQTSYQPKKQYSGSRSWFSRKPGDKTDKDKQPEREKPQKKPKQLRCYICDSPNHLACHCQRSKTESTGGKLIQTKTSKGQGPGTNVIRDNSSSSVKGSSRCVEVNVEGIPITGVIDTGSDITILRGDVFYQIVSDSDLDVLDLKPAEQVKACTYDRKPIHLDGQIDMEVSFDEKVITTTVYIKLVASDQLLLSEKVCHLLGIVNYHPSVKSSQPIVNVICNEQCKESVSCDSGASTQLSDKNGSEPTNQESQGKDPAS